MQIRCVAVDDEPLALNLIKEYTAQFPSLDLVGTFHDAIAGADFLKNTRVDLLFIDISMPDITGIELVRSLAQKPIVVFTTAHKKFAHLGYELEALDYLLKPIAFDRFSRTIQKALEHFRYTGRSKDREALFVYSEYRIIRIDFDEILYIEGLEDYIKIHLRNEKSIMTLMSLKKVLEKLPFAEFKRIHRSYIVAVSAIKAISKGKAVLSPATELPISYSYRSSIKEWAKK